MSSNRHIRAPEFLTLRVLRYVFGIAAILTYLLAAGDSILARRIAAGLAGITIVLCLLPRGWVNRLWSRLPDVPGSRRDASTPAEIAPQVADEAAARWRETRVLMTQRLELLSVGRSVPLLPTPRFPWSRRQRILCELPGPRRLRSPDGADFTLEAGTCLAGEVSIAKSHGPMGDLCNESIHDFDFARVSFEFEHEGERWVHEGYLTQWDLLFRDGATIQLSMDGFVPDVEDIALMLDHRDWIWCRTTTGEERRYRAKYLSGTYRLQMRESELLVHANHRGEDGDFTDAFYSRPWGELLLLCGAKMSWHEGLLEDFDIRGEEFGLVRRLPGDRPA